MISKSEYVDIYQKFLESLSNTRYDYKAIGEWWYEKLTKPPYDFIDIKDNGESVGFLAIKEIWIECKSYYEIAQSYIRVDHRGNGLMTKALNEYIKDHKGRYFLIVLKKNYTALRFWQNYFIRKNAKDISNTITYKDTYNEGVRCFVYDVK